MQLSQQHVWVIWDLAAIVIFYLSVRKCAKKGFVSTVAGLLIYIIAAAAAGRAYLVFADFLYDNVVHDAVRQVLVRSFNNMLDATGETKDIVHAMPFILRMLVGFNRGKVGAIPLTDASVMADSVIDIALRSSLTSILHGVGFLLLFTVAAHIMRYIAKLFTRINRVPVIGLFNTVMGGILGVIEGVLTLFILGFVIRILIGVSGEVWWWLNTSVIQSTYIWKLVF